ncbi:MAG: transposase [Desulfobacterales bacterium]|nr:transposase [Desulfobacterales bacterium]MDD4073753.1 transposase [Desulfobacterales bacterium]
MARANRHFIPAYIWHITHRCHKKEFLLKFGKDRKRWLTWLHQAKKRFGLCVLNYMVTSNHIHLLVKDTVDGAIPKSIQLIAGRTGQEFNIRKKRKGAFWEDRYHATAIDTDQHLRQCMIYINLNMVRAGVVSHPSEWVFSGYHEILKPPRRYRLIDREELMKSLGLDSSSDLSGIYQKWIDAELQKSKHREKKWSESIAVGRVGFVNHFRERSGHTVKGRNIIGSGETVELREHQSPYSAVFDPKNAPLRPKNMYCWNEFDEISI